MKSTVGSPPNRCACAAPRLPDCQALLRRGPCRGRIPRIKTISRNEVAANVGKTGIGYCAARGKLRRNVPSCWPGHSQRRSGKGKRCNDRVRPDRLTLAFRINYGTVRGRQPRASHAVAQRVWPKKRRGAAFGCVGGEGRLPGLFVMLDAHLHTNKYKESRDQ